MYEYTYNSAVVVVLASEFICWLACSYANVFVRNCLPYWVGLKAATNIHTCVRVAHSLTHTHTLALSFTPAHASTKQNYAKNFQGHIFNAHTRTQCSDVNFQYLLLLFFCCNVRACAYLLCIACVSAVCLPQK